jgi:hypothetical protein
MSRTEPHFLLCLMLICCSLASAQSTVPSSPSAVVPRWVNFSGKATDGGKVITGVAGATFAIYRDESGGSPLWLETQSIQADANGHYTVRLGSTKPEGLPLDLFASGEARWLGVSINAAEEQPRILLLSVPYALKAADAETLGGIPASAFLLAAAANTAAAPSNTAASAQSSGSPAVSSDVTTSGGTVDTIPLFSTATNIQSSILTQTGSGTSGKLGINTATPASTLDVNGASTIRGNLSLPATGTATTTGGKNSQPATLTASAYNSSTSAAVAQNFRWQAEPAGNNSAAPSGNLSLLYSSGTATPAETGLKISSKGVFTFAAGQTFPGTGTITNVKAGTALTGGGTSGAVTLNVDPTKVPLLAANNTFTGNQTVNGNLSATEMVSGSGFEIGSNLFDSGSFANANAFFGFAGNTTATGGFNTAGGYAALQSVTNGIENTAMGYTALRGNTAASANTAVGYAVLPSNSGSFNTAIGMQAMSSNSSGYQDTAIGVAALSANTTGYYNAATGLDALRFNTTGYANTASGYAALYSNTTTCCNTAVGTQALVNSNVGSNCTQYCSNDAFGYQALYGNTNGVENEAFGYQAAYSNAGGYSNSAFGFRALYSNAGGCYNINGCIVYGFGNSAFGAGALFSNNCTGSCGGSTIFASLNSAFGDQALGANTTGSSNTAVGYAALSLNTTGSSLTCIGVSCTASDNVSNATAIGAHALVEQSNSLVLGAIGTNVGIGTTKPSNILTIGRGLGHPVSDSWETYSSRRWKTNIHPLQNALTKVEQLRGVSYDLKASGRHEIGVIAEEVGAVVPEVVSFEENGKDARGVDYSRLTALLIEAVKAQQKQITAQAGQVRLLRSELKRRAVKEAALESRLEQLEQGRSQGQLASVRPNSSGHGN